MKARTPIAGARPTLQNALKLNLVRCALTVVLEDAGT